MHAPRLTALLFLILLSGTVRAGSGQNLRIGTTWAVPSDSETALRELSDIQAAGFRAVRMGGLATAEIYRLADTLRIDLYQDLPVRALAAADLADTLSFASAVMGDVLALSVRYGSLRGIGLADLADTSDPEACAYFAEMTRRARQQLASVSTYYTTRFREADRCAGDVDEVLVDILDAEMGSVEQLAASAPPRTGVAAAGTWTDLELDRGLNHPRSPESQARYLEQVLRILTSAWAGGDSRILFVHRWRDPISSDDVFGDLVQRRYGLHNASGGPRPALDVARGFATGQQTTFAFEAGSSAGRGWIWMTFLGWGMLSILGVAYATSPRMRHMVPRYFLSHAFYREAVISGRESLVAESITVLASVSVGAGMLLAILLAEISLLSVFEIGRMWLDADEREFLGALLDQPWTLSLILASGVALIAVGWTSVLSLLSRTRQTLLPAQVMMLVIWPQWTLLSLLLVSPAIATVSAPHRLEVAVAVFLVTFALGLFGVFRTLLDYWRCSRVSPGLLALGAVLHPIVLLCLAVLAYMSRHADGVAYLWHLVTRS